MLFLPKGVGGGSILDLQETPAPFRTQAISAQMPEPADFANLAGQRKGMGWADARLLRQGQLSPNEGRPSPNAEWGVDEAAWPQMTQNAPSPSCGPGLPHIHSWARF